MEPFPLPLAIIGGKYDIYQVVHGFLVHQSVYGKPSSPCNIQPGKPKNGHIKGNFNVVLSPFALNKRN